MGERAIRLPDVGEGVAEAELVEWHVKVGDPVREDAILAAVMTDKATVEIPSPVDGEIAWLGADVGEIVAVGATIVRIRTGGDATESEAVPDPEADGPRAPEASPVTPADAEATDAEARPRAAFETPRISRPAAPAAKGHEGPARPEGEKPLASPAVRRRAQDGGVDLRRVSGSGPAGRILHEDLDAYFKQGSGLSRSRGGNLVADISVEEIKVVGLRRRIAEKMALAASRIPHITYVEEIDVTALEELRGKLNGEAKSGRPKLTILPFLMRAMVKAIADQPALNAHYDDEAGVLRRHGGVHVGIATQTDKGLTVPVVRHCEARDIFDCAEEVARLSAAARDGSATREELSGSTITITSLGAMGGVATTPIINHPEVAIVGVNKIVVRPVWDGSQFLPRKIMNLSSSFDHRVVDGWDAAVFVQRIRALLETPALLFMER